VTALPKGEPRRLPPTPSPAVTILPLGELAAKPTEKAAPNPGRNLALPLGELAAKPTEREKQKST